MSAILSLLGWGFDGVLLVVGVALIAMGALGKPALLANPAAAAFTWMLPIVRWVGVALAVYGGGQLYVREQVRQALAHYAADQAAEVARVQAADRAAANAAVTAAQTSAAARAVALDHLHRSIADAPAIDCADPALRAVLDGLRAGAGNRAP